MGMHQYKCSDFLLVIFGNAGQCENTARFKTKVWLYFQTHYFVTGFILFMYIHKLLTNCKNIKYICHLILCTQSKIL